jgi:polar amino acid transport system substrate-binding protein
MMPPVLHVDMRVYSIGDTSTVARREDMIGKTVIGIRGYSYGGFIRYLENPDNNITLDLSDSHLHAFRKLEKGRAEYFIGFNNPSKKALASHPVEGLKSNSLVKIPIYFMVSKNAPDAANLFKRFTGAIDQLNRENKISLGQ